MSFFDRAADERDRRVEQRRDQATATVGGATSGEVVSARDATVEVAGESVTIEEPDTVSGSDDGTWLTGSGKYGIPRGHEAIEARQIVQTSAMQSIANGITDQLVGGELTFESDDNETGNAEADVQAVIRDILTGPHLGGHDLDDLITASVEDMLGPGDAFWQLLGPAGESELPVVALKALDPLTIRRNVNRHGYPQDPPYWQALGAFTSDGVSSLGQADPVELTDSDIAVMHYPRGNRSYTHYPVSPAQQVKEWLTILADSTTHHGRFYSDSEIPPGLISVIEQNGTTTSDIKDEIETASGDPRKAPVVSATAQWVELGGTAVNLNIIEEQRWFFQLCLASLGLGKQELGFIEDVNRSNGEVESSRIYKRIKGPFAKQFESAFQHVAEQFDVYNALDDPFDIRLRFTDPREERAREERLRQMYNDGGLTLRQYIRRRGDEDLADTDLSVTINGETIDYGDHPKHVVEHLLREARNDPDSNADMGGDGASVSGGE
jgi:hypothetical protein